MYKEVRISLHCTSSPRGPPLKALSAILNPDSLVSAPMCTRIYIIDNKDKREGENYDMDKYKMNDN